MNIYRDLKRRQALAAFVRQANVPGHTVQAAEDLGKFFRSRPGSADWKAHCTCGWKSSAYHYGETEALASAARHLRSVLH